MKTLFSIIVLMLLTSMIPDPQVAITGRVTGPGEAPLKGVTVKVKESDKSVTTGTDGRYTISVGTEARTLLFLKKGMQPVEEPISGRTVINIRMEPLLPEPQAPAQDTEISEVFCEVQEEAPMISAPHKKDYDASARFMRANDQAAYYYHQPVNTESYADIDENGYKDPRKSPLSTFSIDVDNASYSNVRRFINLGQKVPADAVRIEEMINYFKYDYPQPSGEHPFSVYTETGICPWNKNHYLLHIGLRGKDIDKDELPPSNLVFLIDVSGSMNYPNKLPLLKSAFGLLVNELRAQDRVAIVVYAGAAGVVLESTPGNHKETITEALDKLHAGGSTAGGAGLMLAYKIAGKNFIKGGNNRIILATDGDFNVGVSDNASMERLVEEKRGLGIYMTVLGFGMGNIKDDKMEIIADKGNGNYAYIDNIQEARKILVQEFGGTLFTIAKDVKFQIEFNPAYVRAYRLVGYENRMLADEDFNDDTKDAGEMGAGHTVTALYEIVPAGSEETGLPLVDPLRYQNCNTPIETVSPLRNAPRELCNIKLRYKEPDRLTSKMFSKTVSTDVKSINQTTDRFRFSAAVAAFGMILRDSRYKGNATLNDVIAMASDARGSDPDGYRAEFVRLVQSTK
jgi:Ca-activated chloride channel family protein